MMSSDVATEKVTHLQFDESRPPLHPLTLVVHCGGPTWSCLSTLGCKQSSDGVGVILMTYDPRAEANIGRSISKQGQDGVFHLELCRRLDQTFHPVVSMAHLGFRRAASTIWRLLAARGLNLGKRRLPPSLVRESDTNPSQLHESSRV